jgi:signal transduction histidine kinase
MLRSFRVRLFLGFAVVIALSLFLSASASIWLLRQQQVEAAQQRIGLLVDPIARRVATFEAAGWPLPLIRQDLEQVASSYDIRVLLVDPSDVVIVDTDPTSRMVGKQLAVPSTPVAQNDTRQMSSFHAVRMTTDGEDLYLFTPSILNDVGGSLPGSSTRLVIAVPAQNVTAAWSALLPRLSLAGGVAALVAVIVASLLASRITNPIAQMTRASEAMARGDLQQRVEGEGEDEIGTLARAFNQMSQQVSRSNRAMRDLLANVSHELKTPITSIRGFAQAMVDGMATKPEDYTDMAGSIYDEAERIRVLVDDLLYLSEIESGTLQLTLDQVDVDAIVDDTVRRFRYQAEAADVRVRQALAGGDVRADARRVEQILANLTENAIRFAPAGSEVLLRTYRLDGRTNGRPDAGSEGSVAIEVHNGGPPIAPEHLPYLFERFYQADGSRSDERHKGLGLAIVRELVQAHDGQVTVESSADAGTVFTVRLPVAGPAAGGQRAASSIAGGSR